MSSDPIPQPSGELCSHLSTASCALVLFDVRHGKRIIQTGKHDFRVGRDHQKCEVVLDPLDLSASREHFRVENRSVGHFLTNLSPNGTLVNGERVGSKGRRLYHGDVIEAGNSELTFLIMGELLRAVPQLLLDGQAREKLDPAYSIQCYALALREQPDNAECAARLVGLLVRQGRYEELVTGGNYFNAQVMLQLAHDPRIAFPLATAQAKVGDFAAAMRLVNLAGGPGVNSDMAGLARQIAAQTGGQLLRTIPNERAESTFFQRESLRVYVDEQADFVDLRYVERYYKYIRHRIDPLFGGPLECNVEFHISIRDQFFAQSLPGQAEVLGYYSPSSQRIFIRPRRWVEGNGKEDDFHVVLSHEYVHLRVHVACGSVLPPKWYNEGLAQLFTDEGRILPVHALQGLSAGLREIDSFTDESFSPDMGDPTPAYLQSAVMIRHLALGFGKEHLVSVLRSMGMSGKTFSAAFEEAFHMSLSEFDRQWRKPLGAV